MNSHNNVRKNKKMKDLTHNSKLKAFESSLNNDTRLKKKRRKYSRSHNIKSELVAVDSHKLDDFSERKSKSNNDIWFDDIPKDLIAASMQDQSASSKSLVKASSFNGLMPSTGIPTSNLISNNVPDWFQWHKSSIQCCGYLAKIPHGHISTFQVNETTTWFVYLLVKLMHDDKLRYYLLDAFISPTKHIAIDCEFVGVGYEGKENALARVSVVNQFGHVLLDSFVRPRERVVDYRTQYSGVRAHDLRQGGPARSFNNVHNEVAKLCKGRILIGHSIGNDLKVLMISHPRRDIRDTSRYRPFRDLFSGRTPSLRALTERVLGVTVQAGEHDSVEDARAAMRLYTSVKRVWEAKKKRRSTCTSFNKVTTQNSGSINSLRSPNSSIVPKLDIKSEFESGFEDVNKNDLNKSEMSKKISRSKPWDNTRGRLCSKKRAKFLHKRRKSSQKRFQ